MSKYKELKRKIAKGIGTALYFFHYIPLPKCKLPNYEEAFNIIRNAGYDFPPLWKEIPPLATTCCDLSIVIPVYNSEDFISRCLSSILNQKTRFDYEVICINDGSTDSSSTILNNYKSEYGNRIIIYHQNNQGISKARNQGVKMAKGKYISFLDNDDTVSPDYVEKIMQVAQETNADIVQTAFDFVDKNGKRFKEKPKQKKVLRELDSYEMYYHVSGYIWGGAIKKDLFSKIRFPEGFWYEDMIMRIILMRMAKVYATVPEMLYHKTSHSHNASDILWKRETTKNIDQYWLPTQLINYQRKELNIPFNTGQYLSLLEQHSTILWSRTHKLKAKIFKSLFVLASEDIIQSRFIPDKIDKESLAIESALKSKDYYAWILLSASRFYSGFAK